MRCSSNTAVCKQCVHEREHVDRFSKERRMDTVERVGVVYMYNGCVR